MTIAFFSSVLNHHQIEFCDALYEIYGDGFTFVSTMDIEEQRIQLGYKLYERPYNLLMHKSDENQRKGQQLFQNADVVILGVFLEEWLQQRLRNGKITFLIKERLFKKFSLYWWMRCLLFVAREYWPHRNKPFYMLAASAYSYKDYRSLGFFKKKAFAWGYFPPFAHYCEDELFRKKDHKKVHIFWAGRMLAWKHPLYVLDVADDLKAKCVGFEINIAGNGPELETMEAEIRKRGLEDVVHLLNSIPPQEVRKYMEEANIYLFTSDREEGFGAVLTEAMNSGCAVVASATAGATNLLIRDGENGFVYHHDDCSELKVLVQKLIVNRQLMEKIGRNAYRTIIDEQNAFVAANRFSQVAEAMLNENPLPYYPSGPMHFWE